jgi:hypothetical protein
MSETGHEYKEGDHNEFIQYLFGSEPQAPHSIVLESPPLDPSKNRGLHTFEQLLMIFVDGMKYFHGSEEGMVNINEVSLQHIEQINRYFHSMDYEVSVDLFETMYDYQFKYPNYFKDQDKITDKVGLSDFYYEMFGHNNRVFRVSFAIKSA